MNTEDFIPKTDGTHVNLVAVKKKEILDRWQVEMLMDVGKPTRSFTTFLMTDVARHSLNLCFLLLLSKIYGGDVNVKC